MLNLKLFARKYRWNTMFIDASNSIDGIRHRLYLFGNMIAELNCEDELTMTLAGWPTATTRKRLNQLLAEAGRSDCGFSQRKGVQYFKNGDDSIVIASPFSTKITVQTNC